MFTISVDSTRCQGHARCLVYAAEIFEFDDEGYSFVPEGKSQQVELSDGLRLAIANCPERAIVVTERPS